MCPVYIKNRPKKNTSLYVKNKVSFKCMVNMKGEKNMHKLTVTGYPETPIRKVDKMISFELISSGNSNAPKDLNPSGEITYSIIMNEKQYKKIENELTSKNIEFKNAFIVINGEPTLDVSTKVCKGEIGVVTFKAEIIEDKCKQTTKSPAHYPAESELVPIETVVISEEFASKTPRTLNEAIEQLKQTDTIDKPIAIDEKNVLVDGYKRFLALKSLKYTHIPVVKQS